MKKNLCIVLFCFLSNPIFAQTTYFNKIIDPQPFNGANNVISMVRKDSSIFIWGGNLPDTGWQQNKSILHLDLTGNIVNQKLVSVPHHWLSSVPVNSLIDDGTGLLAIGAVIDTNNHGKAFMIKTDYNLDTLWTRAFPHPDAATYPVPPTGSYSYCHLMAVRSTPDGGYIAAGRYNPNYLAGYTLRTFLLKTDSLGNKEWMKTYPGYDATYSLEVTQNNGYAFTAFGGFQLVVTDHMGNLISSILAPSPPPCYRVRPATSVKQFANGDFAMACLYAKSEPVPNSYHWGIYLLRINSSGEVVKKWNKTFGPFISVECRTMSQWLEMQILPDQSIVFMGNARVNPSIQYKGFLMKLSPSGDSLWARHYNYGKWEDWSQFYSMVQTDDGGFLIGGSHINLNPGTTSNASIWLVKVDSLGCDTPGCHLIGIEERVLSIQELEVFPNPFSDIMHVVLPDGYSGGKLLMYDVQGKKAMETEVPANWGQQNFALETTLMKPGIYLLELSDRDGRLWRRKTVKK
jgi:hypothetical protein